MSSAAEPWKKAVASSTLSGREIVGSTKGFLVGWVAASAPSPACVEETSVVCFGSCLFKVCSPVFALRKVPGGNSPKRLIDKQPAPDAEATF